MGFADEIRKIREETIRNEKIKNEEEKTNNFFQEPSICDLFADEFYDYFKKCCIAFAKDDSKQLKILHLIYCKKPGQVMVDTDHYYKYYEENKYDINFGKGTKAAFSTWPKGFFPLEWGEAFEKKCLGYLEKEGFSRYYAFPCGGDTDIRWYRGTKLHRFHIRVYF